MVAERGHRDRRDRHPGARRPGGRRPAGRRRRDQHPQLRAVRAVGAGRGRRAQGRPRHRAADPVLPRAPQGRRPRCRATGGVRARPRSRGGLAAADRQEAVGSEPARRRRCPTAPPRSSLLERLAVAADELARDAGPSCSRSRTSARPWCSPPATGSRSTPRSTGSTAASPTSATVLADRAGLDVADARPSTCTCTTRTRPCGTCSGSPPAWTRWWSARRRSSASCATRTRSAAEPDAAGRLLHELMQQALRVGKRVHAETGIDRAGAERGHRSALAQAARTLGRARRPAGAGDRRRLDGRAGRGHADPAPASAPLVVTNRPRRAGRAAGRQLDGASARVPLDDAAGRARPVPTSWSAATASTGTGAARGDGRGVAAGARRPAAGAARPRRCRATSTPAVAALPGVTCIDLDLAALQRAGRSARRARGRRARPRQIVAERGRRLPRLAARAAEVAPTVAALRARADEVVDAELPGWTPGCPDLDRRPRAEVARTVHRVVQRLLHAPDRPGQGSWPSAPGGDAYADALRELFDLDPAADRRGRRPPCRRATSRRTAPMTPLPLRSAPGAARWRWPRPATVADALTGRDRIDGRAGRDRHRRRPVDRAGDPDRRHRACSSPRCATRCSAGEIDFAVHSYKDLPTAPADGLRDRGRAGAGGPARRAGRPGRADPGRAAARRRASAPARRAGSPSCTRSACGVEVVPIRGNVDTRLRKVGRRRAGRGGAGPGRAGPARPADAVTETLDPMLMLPAPAQGALAVECRGPTTRAGRAARRARRRRLPGRGHRGAGAAGHAGGRVLRPGRRLAELAEGDDGDWRSTCAVR